MRLTVVHVMVFLAAGAHVVESAKFLTPHIVRQDAPHTTVFDSSTGTIKTIAGTNGILLSCVRDKLDTINKDDIKYYYWEKTITGQPGYTSTGSLSQSITIKENGNYGFKCRVVSSTVSSTDSDYSYPATILILGAPPLGSHPKVSSPTSTSVDVSWKKPTTTDTFTDYDIKIFPIYSKETASAVKGDEENPTTHLTNLQPWTLYEVTVRIRIALAGDDAYGPEKKQSFMTTKDVANQMERSLMSIITCFIVSICIAF